LALAPAPVDTEVVVPSPGLDRATPFELGEAYSCALDASARLSGGCHYTPALLAAALWSELRGAGTPNGARVSDPACGAGALLIPAVREVLSDPAGDVENALARVEQQVGGQDLDPQAVWLGNAILGAELLPTWASIPPERRQPLPRLMTTGDGLACSEREAEITVMNPPYGRVRLAADDRARWTDSLFGHANRFGLFLHAAIERTAPDGLIGAVLPTSFLGGAYYQRLRELIASQAPLVRLVFVDERSGVFSGDVLQETCLAVFRRGQTAEDVVCSIQPTDGRRKLHSIGRVRLPHRRRDLPWLLPRAERDTPLVDRAAGLTARLSDYGWKASTGPLVWNRHKPQISAEPGEGALPIVWAADLRAGRVEASRARARQRWIRLRERDEFMRLSQPAVLVQRTTAPEQQRRLVVSVLDRETLEATWGGSVVVENHVNVLRCAAGDSPLTPRVLAALLSSDPVDRLYRCLTGSVAVSAYELEALPLPGAEVLLHWRERPTEEVVGLADEFYG
jgi:adenine-specific DNA-methyltransferase